MSSAQVTAREDLETLFGEASGSQRTRPPRPTTRQSTPARQRQFNADPTVVGWLQKQLASPLRMHVVFDRARRDGINQHALLVAAFELQVKSTDDGGLDALWTVPIAKGLVPNEAGT